MTTFRRLGLLAAAAILCFSAACGGNKGEGGGGGTTEPAGGSGDVYKNTGDEGTIIGKVTFTGTAPAKKIDMSNDAFCSSQHPGGLADDAVVVNDGKLDNVFVYIKDGLGNKVFATPTSEVTLDQHGCIYKPHVMGVQTKQPFKVITSDATNHNINVLATKNEPFNVSQGPGAAPISKTFPREETLISVKCNQHSWMKSYIGVLKHPFFSVSQNGTYTLKDVPPGEYTIVAWHEKYGEKTAKVTVGKKDSKTQDFAFEAASASNVMTAPSGMKLAEMTIDIPHQH